MWIQRFLAGEPQREVTRLSAKCEAVCKASSHRLAYAMPPGMEPRLDSSGHEFDPDCVEGPIPDPNLAAAFHDEQLRQQAAHDRSESAALDEVEAALAAVEPLAQWRDHELALLTQVKSRLEAIRGYYGANLCTLSNPSGSDITSFSGPAMLRARAPLPVPFRQRSTQLGEDRTITS